MKLLRGLIGNAARPLKTLHIGRTDVPVIGFCAITFGLPRGDFWHTISGICLSHQAVTGFHLFSSALWRH